MNLNDKRAMAYGKSSSYAEKKAETKADGVFQSLKQNENAGNILYKVPGEEKKSGESVYRRVAKFLLIIGTERSSEILRHLSEEQVEKIVPELATIRSVGADEREVILAEFEGLANRTFENGGKQTAFTILSKAYGPEKAEEMVLKATAAPASEPFEYLKSCDAEKIGLLLDDESAGIQALVLSYVEPKKAAAVINGMKSEAKKDVVRHLANLGSVNPDFLHRVSNAMREKSNAILTEKSSRLDGRNALAQILKNMAPGSERSIIDSLSADDPELALDLKERLFTMDDVLNADDRFIQDYLKSLSDMDIVFLIAGKNPEYRKKILGCVSLGRKTKILDEESVNKPISRIECDKATARFLTSLRSSFDAGHLVIKGRNDKDYI